MLLEEDHFDDDELNNDELNQDALTTLLQSESSSTNDLN